MDIDVNALVELMKALEQYDVHELSMTFGETKVRMRRGEHHRPHQTVMAAPSVVAAPMMSSASPLITQPPQMVATPQQVAAHSPSTPPPAPAAEAADDSLYITCPLVGTFYRAPSPDDPSFVNVGDSVGPDSVVCIVEAMKLMNEIPAEVTGVIEEILVENGKPVEFGDKLFRIRKG